MGGVLHTSRLIPIFFLAVLAATPLSFAAGNWYDTLPVWMGISLTISAIVIGLAYMVARLFQVQVLEAWVKIELSELAASAFIAVFCIALIATVNTSAQFLGGQQNGDIVDLARTGYLNNSVYSDGSKIYAALGTAYFNVAKSASYAYTAGLSLGVASFSYSQSPASGLFPLASELGQAMDSVSTFMLLAVAQASFLLFFKNAAAIMLPVGIFLRSFSFTRKIGGVVLAGVIATSVIYPASFMVSREVYDTFSSEMVSSIPAALNELPAVENPPSTGVVCNPYMQMFVQSPVILVGGETGWYITICVPLSWIPGFSEVCKQVINILFLVVKALFPIVMYCTVLMPFANKLASPDLAADYYNPLYDHMLPAVTKYAVLSTISFLIPIIITMTMVRNLAITFGGEPQLYGLSKLV